METKGLLHLKSETQIVSDKFKKRNFVLKTESETPYSQMVEFQITQDKCAMLDKFNEGDELTVQFNLRGREWDGPQGIKYFNTLEAWRIDKVSDGVPVQNAPSNNVGTNNGADFGDLPF